MNNVLHKTGSLFLIAVAACIVLSMLAGCTAVPQAEELPVDPLVIATDKGSGGESAGAYSISNLIESSRAKGLFNRTILESGNDGLVLPEDPCGALQQGNVNGVDILVGFNTDEGSIFVPQDITEQDYITYVQSIFGDRATAVLERYPADDDHTPEDRAQQVFKIALRLGSDIFADEVSGQGHDVYFYNFDYTTQALSDAGYGAGHVLELFFVFDTLPVSVQAMPELEALVETVHSYWLNFIKTGSPNTTGLPTWSNYNVAFCRELVWE